MQTDDRHDPLGAKGAALWIAAWVCGLLIAAAVVWLVASALEAL